LNTPEKRKAFFFNFIRMHNRLPGSSIEFNGIDDVLAQKEKFRTPLYVVARKQDYFWNVREKIFE
jgi:DNA repair protein RadD